MEAGQLGDHDNVKYQVKFSNEITNLILKLEMLKSDYGHHHTHKSWVDPKRH